MMAVHWYPEPRRRLEQRLLDRYHARLVAHSTDYDRAALADGRLSTAASSAPRTKMDDE